jgi:isopentenyl-diphosphate delta-isomerase
MLLLIPFMIKNSGLTEHEFDYVITGNYTGAFNLNPAEVSSIKWISITELKVQLAKHPEDYTPWFKHILQKHLLFKELSLQPMHPK